MAWSYEHLALGLFGYGERLRLAIKALCRLTGFWLRFLDAAAARNPASDDAASGFYFLGAKSSRPVPDEEIVAHRAEARARDRRHR